MMDIGGVAKNGQKELCKLAVTSLYGIALSSQAWPKGVGVHAKTANNVR
jgi:hypothetical protein